MKRKRAIALCLVILCAALVAWLILPANRPAVTMRFLRYDETARGRLGVFVVSNSSPRAYLISGYEALQYCEAHPRGWIDGSGGGEAFLLSTTAAEITLPPSPQRPWRGEVSCRLDSTGDKRLRTRMLAAGAQLGLPTKYHQFALRSHWIER
jgi:hypothetical protein